MRAKVFTLENELDQLKVEVSEKDQLSEQVHCQPLCSSSGSLFCIVVFPLSHFVRDSRTLQVRNSLFLFLLGVRRDGTSVL